MANGYPVTMSPRRSREEGPMVKTTLRVPAEVWEAARIRAIQERRTFQEVLADALRLYLKTKPEKGGRR